MTINEVALQYIDAGLCTLPAIKAEKRPAIGKRWKEYQYRLPTKEEWKCWFADALCIVCGAVSGNLRVIDFDQQGKAFAAFKERCAPDLFDRLVIETSQSGGYHVIFRTEAAMKVEQKLARDADGKTLIETLGEGKLFLCAPTPGYGLIQGDFCNLPTLQKHEAEALFELVRALNEYKVPPLPPPSPKRSAPTPTDGKRPGDALNESGIGFIKEILQKHGWTYVGQKSEHDELWRRPGKNVSHSAIFHTDTPTFHVFSSDAAPISEGTHTYFNVYALLEHGGDFSAAAKELPKLGYGDALIPAPTELPDFMNEFPTPKQEAEETIVPAPMPGKFDVFAVENHDELEQFDIEDPGLIPEDMLNPPGLVGNIAQYCIETNSVPQQEFALATGIVMVAHLIGKNYRTPDNLRSNLYVMAIGESGAGKNKAIEFLLDPEIVQIDKKIMESFTSPQAINAYLRNKGSLLMAWDELGGKMEEMLKKPNAIFNQVLYCLTALYSAAGRAYFPDGKAADVEYTPIFQPHCCLYGAGTYESVFKTFEPKLIENGFIGRVSFFFADPSKKLRKLHDQPPIPKDILESIKAWMGKPLVLPKPEEQQQPLFQAIPEPIFVAYTEEAEQIFSQLTDRCEAAQEKTPDNIKRLWVRTVQEAKKLALIYACSKSIEHPSIDAEAATWGCRLSEHLTRRKLHIAHYHMAESEQERLENDIIRYIKKQDKQRVTQTKLINRFRKGVIDYMRDNAIKNLVRTGQLVSEKITTQGAKKPTTIYRIAYKKE